MSREKSATLTGGLRVLVTRPIEQSAGLADAIQNSGGEPIVMPLLRIEPIDSSDGDSDHRERLEHSDTTAVFLSPNAVRHGLNHLNPQTVRATIVAMGAGTAAQLQARGLKVSGSPITGISSEALLEHPVFEHVLDRTVVVFQGEGGRDVVQRELAQRGARVFRHICYRRLAPVMSPDDFSVQWEAARPAVCIITSAAALENLLELSGTHRNDVLATRFVVPGARLASRVREAGATHVFESSDASDEGLLRAVIDASD